MRHFWLIAIGSILCGCGGGGGGDSTPAPVTASTPSAPAPTPIPPPATSADLGGVWFGTLNYGARGVDDVVALTTADGRFAIIAVDTVGPEILTQFVGVATLTGQRVTGAGTMYAAPGPRWPGTGTVLPIELDLTLVNRRTLTGRLSSGTALDAHLYVEYDGDTHGRPSSLASLLGVWYVYDGQIRITTLSIEPDGRFLEQSASRCQSSGQISLIDSRYNVYAWDATIMNCARSGSYSGLGTLVDIDPGAPAAFLVAMASATNSIVLLFER